ncbi:hypothetical protein BTUL_0056g00050 [Botrytis tulipae]|uniref:Uncharacterized protein n=1 Tax=Botrytis tulipae TaxID=87230 RepID=A0A4Z1ET28_9HELO|nr:hypothetical protein BTUL_0056g00050 [Botrytis tulipae]
MAQLYEEGSKVLYERNEFIVNCSVTDNRRPKLHEAFSSDHVYLHDNLDVYAISDTLVVSPLTRLLEDILVRTYSMRALLQFCRAVCEIAGLEITFLRLGNENERIVFNKAPETWDSLKLLRKVAKVEFREATRDGIPEYMFYHGSWDDYHCKGLLSTVNSLEGHVALMKGSLPLNSRESIHLQYERLLAYAQAFECNPEFRADLDLPPDVNAKLPRWGCPNNVFRAKNLHQIEENVSAAHTWISCTDIRHFRRFRNQALLELEKQCEAINRHALEFNGFIKSEKRCEGFFGLAG